MQTLETHHEKAKTFSERYYGEKSALLSGDIGRLACSELVGLERRFDAEIVSGVSEALNGRVVSDCEFDVVDGKIVADDGEQLETMMLRSRMRAYETAASNPLMQFVVDRFEAELEELHAQQAMTLPGATYNTIITNSPMTFELGHRPDLLKKGYQRPDLTRSMTRISHWDGKKMHVFTRSLDSSSLDLLSSMTYDALGYRYRATDSIGMLRECIVQTTTIAEARSLAGKLCDSYAERFYRKTGIRAEQGAIPVNNTNLVKFVQSHPEILANIRREVDEFLPNCRTYTEFQNKLNQCLYRYLALFDEVLRGRDVSSMDIAGSASDAGGRAAETGVVYSMCGELITGGDTEVGAQTGFESLMSYSGKKVQCPNEKCRKVVVIEDKYLTDGVMHCKACKHTVDVCGDKAKALRIKKSEMKKAEKAENSAIKKAKKVLNNKSPKRWSIFLS